MRTYFRLIAIYLRKKYLLSAIQIVPRRLVEDNLSLISWISYTHIKYDTLEYLKSINFTK